MLGFLKSLFSTPKLAETAGKIVEAGASGIDKLFYTEEEKAENAQKTFSLWLEAQKILIHESSVRSITRRYLAVMIVGSFLFLVLSSAFLYALDIKTAGNVFSCAKSLSGLTLMVSAFYFGYYGVQQMLSGNNKKERRG